MSPIQGTQAAKMIHNFVIFKKTIQEPKSDFKISQKLKDDKN